MKKINLDTWPRAEHYHFFKGFDKPHFNITTNLDLSLLYRYAKQQQYSFTDCYLYCLLKAVNSYTPMRYRIVDGLPVEVDELMASTVFLKEDDTFRFIPLSLQQNITEFAAHTAKQKAIYLNKTLLDEQFMLRETSAAQIHVSILPWFNFSSFSHAATSQGTCVGIPKFVFGQYQIESGLMPLNIEVHHALLDGVHVAQFLTTLNKVISEVVK
ncbi:CatA-like O-acetyltransferase [Pseudoalteromonas sp. MMG022]|uniref:CatA-like O-acetyltransferase n=1 Tax=Pseudoalteromonas sp. MMG022 TaxID=2909978 RepID=UPI001F45ED18|nr:CatA-like O-acetyltransferase [Pseudoalteromonas sp. MMG022]MCF6435102.1 CatA-like O-acetyltransferase [Pseudoalteromonas sp. MMG022]